MPEPAGPYVGLPTREKQGSDARAEAGGEAFEPPAVTLPKGGGAIRGIGEKFAANPVTGTGSLTIPVACSPGRSGFGPELTLSYDSGAGNGEFGFGWSQSAPSIARKTDKGLPRYDDSDVFVMSGAEDLVPMLVEQNGKWKQHTSTRTLPDGSRWRVERYRPRIEGNLTRIERWTNSTSGEVHWRSISRTNVTTVYGQTSESRIYDPSDERRVFSWLICSTYDDRGNAILYRWKHEDDAGVDRGLANERNRTRSANRHLKRILYGNKTPRAPTEDLTEGTDWLFEVVLDYGEHDDQAPTPLQSGKWTCRRDPFSSYRSGFEVRSYRLCRRVLMFHHFPGEPGVGKDCLVRATELAYREAPVASFLVSVTSRGYRRTTGGGYVTKAMPPLELEYSAPEIGSEVHELDPASAENLPAGLGGELQRWVDLDGEGLSGVLVEQGGAWHYKRNLGRAAGNGSDNGARFGPLEPIASAPSIADLRPQLLDLEGDGQIDLVQVAPPLSGFHERGDDGTWSSFVPFDSMPNLPWDDPNLRFVDLTGDGRADVLITEDAAVRWHHSLGEDGYGAEERVARALDEEAGPRLLIAEGTESVHLADMSGDGLPDLVRIRSGEVSYWPNLGYGRFGAKVTMDRSPNFDPPDLPDPRRIRLADTDGTGATDLIYLAPDGARLYFNEGGTRGALRSRLTASRPTTFPRYQCSTCWETEPPASSRRPRSSATRAGPCATSS